MTLRETIISDASSVFTNTDDFAETVIYYPGGAGSGRTIKAIIDRDVQVITDQGIPALQTFIEVVNDATLGISSTEVDTGRDKVAVSLRINEAAQTRQLGNVVYTDIGMIRIEVN